MNQFVKSLIPSFDCIFLTPNAATRFHILHFLFCSDLSLYIWLQAGKNLPEYEPNSEKHEGKRLRVMPRSTQWFLPHRPRDSIKKLVKPLLLFSTGKQKQHHYGKNKFLKIRINPVLFILGYSTIRTR